MDDAAHARGAAGGHQLARQLHVHALEIGLAAMQDGHQVDDGVAAGEHARKRALVVHVGLHALDRGQRLHGLAAPDAARGHDDAAAGAAAALDELLAHGLADEAGAPGDGDVADHGSSWFGLGAEGSRGPIGPPSRGFRATVPAPSSSAA